MTGRRRRTEQGYVALLVAILFPTLFLGLAATAVDTAQWYVEVQKVQKAADAAALAGVPYLPQDLPSARDLAKEVAARNGYDDATPDVDVAVTQGARPSQLRVTITSRIDNQFGAMIGVPDATIVQTAVADYTGAAPMGSPCNTFGNEPSAGGGSSPGPDGSALGASPFANCSSRTQFWATIEGPETDKQQGDRYQTRGCGWGVEGCSGGTNTEYAEEGYFFLVKVDDAAVNQPIDLQLYDPAFVDTGSTCNDLPWRSNLDDDMNPWVTYDGKDRYSRNGSSTSSTSAPYCTGDYFPGGGSDPMTTSFVLREQTDSHNPLEAEVQTDTGGNPCITQYAGMNDGPHVSDLDENDNDYNDQLAQVFHNWTSLCTFIPTRAGDYYLQVRSNVSPGGSSPSNGGETKLVYTGNAAAAADTGDTNDGAGDNSFAIRAVTPTGLEKSVAVSGWARMPIFANNDAAQSTFNLIRVLPGAAGQFVRFSFFDVGDASNAGTVKVLPPTDATGSITGTPFPGGCTAKGGNAGGGTPLANCTAPISNSTNNGEVETMSIPIPTDYACDYASHGGCWYRVTVSFPSGSVNDITTWDATIVGDPVRLIE